MQRSGVVDQAVQLAVGGDVVDAGIGAGVGDHDQPGVEQHAEAIGHQRSSSRSALRLAPAPGGAASLTRTSTVSSSAAATRACAGDRRGVAIVEPAGDADIGVVGADAVERIEGDPAEILDPGLRPGMAPPPGTCCAVAAEQMAGNVARRDAEPARATAMKMWAKSWQTPWPSAAACSALVSTAGRLGVEAHRLVEPGGEPVQLVERRRPGRPRSHRASAAIAGPGCGQRRRAQEDLGRQIVRQALDDAVLGPRSAPGRRPRRRGCAIGRST